MKEVKLDVFNGFAKKFDTEAGMKELLDEFYEDQRNIFSVLGEYAKAVDSFMILEGFDEDIRQEIMVRIMLSGSIVYKAIKNQEESDKLKELLS